MTDRNPYLGPLLLFVAALNILLLYRSCEPQADAAEVPIMPEVAIPEPLPQDDCLRCATKALAETYGPLAYWQRVGYQQFLKHGPTWRQAWTTQYYPSEGFPLGQGTRWSYPVNERCAAANELPGFSFVWSNRFGIRQVLDTGADSNDRYARDPSLQKNYRRLPADHWLDIWVPHRGDFGFVSEVMPVAAVRGRQPAKWKHGYKPKHTWLDY